MDINFSFPEDTRPPIYSAMKYWGKKPHNIWFEYIKTYTPDKGVFLDPFSGSCESIIESIRAGKKTIGFDLNPLSTFFIKFYLSKFNKNEFINCANEIIKLIESDEIYKNYFKTKCTKCKKDAVAHNHKINNNKIYEVSVICKCQKKVFEKKPDNDDDNLFLNQKNISIVDFVPEDNFPISESFSEDFIKKLGGNNFSNLWPKRSLYVLSKIFSSIESKENSDLKIQLLSAFIQTVHLCTKMSPPRNKEANRPHSTSWGRSAYLYPARQFHSNPLVVFQSSCFRKGKQSVVGSLENASTYLNKKPKVVFVNKGNKAKSNNFELKFGCVDIQNIMDYIDEKSVDFIMTDPPYGGLVKYFDLSLMWLNWLKKIDNFYDPDFSNEITVNTKTANLETYQKRFEHGLKNLVKVLKDNGKIVFTFHNKKPEIWNMFLKSIFNSGLKIEKMLHQQNKRSGESAVSMPYGTSSSDFYIRCIKGKSKKLTTDNDKYKNFVVNKAIEIISSRNEKTPYQFLFNGLLPEISQAGFDLEKFDNNIEKILSEHVGSIFKLTNNDDTKSGNYWWFEDPKKYIIYPDKKLEDRVEDTILYLLRKKTSVTFDEVLAEIFITYPNGLTPDTKSGTIPKFLKKYASKSGGKFIYKALDFEKECTEHTRQIHELIKIGKKLNFNTYVGKREQSEKYKNKKLSEYCDLKNLKNLVEFNKEQLNRLAQIDLLWIKDDKVKYSFEVENSTKFISGIQRGSNLDKSTPKIMVMPDNRRKEFLNNKDPLFIEQFKNYNWSYIFYSDIIEIVDSKNLKIDSLSLKLKQI